MKTPTFKHERELMTRGYRVICGVDEAGAGCLAGPVVAAAVVLPLNSRLKMIRDSKMLTERQREQLFDQIDERAQFWTIGIASVAEIDAWGIRPANLMAMKRAVKQIREVEFALVDAWTIPAIEIPQRGIIRGDQSVKSIAAASIMAKVSRDRLMAEYDRTFPEYGFARHKGYGTKFHRDMIKKHGPCTLHRTSWAMFRSA